MSTFEEVCGYSTSNNKVEFTSEETMSETTCDQSTRGDLEDITSSFNALSISKDQEKATEDRSIALLSMVQATQNIIASDALFVQNYNSFVARNQQQMAYLTFTEYARYLYLDVNVTEQELRKVIMEAIFQFAVEHAGLRAKWVTGIIGMQLSIDELYNVLSSYELFVSKITEAQNIIQMGNEEYLNKVHEFKSILKFTLNLVGKAAAIKFIRLNLHKYIKQNVHELVIVKRNTRKVIGILKAKPLEEILQVLDSIDAL